ncbi:DUF2304 domain-containing protein [[Eubacterium] hominis]|uniref:DUF2304 domain-containing protein n=1 Tax=[Eubacterium] hominis TaxID=2764325 RepID=UPI003A4DE8E3
MSFMTSLMIVLVGTGMLFMILRNVYQKKISEKHGVLWIFCSLLIILGGLFPKGVILIANLFGIEYAPAGIFTFAIILLLILVYKDTQKISGLTIRVQELSMQIALLNLENKRLIEEMAKNRKVSKSELMAGEMNEKEDLIHD